jgi:hypothetical protein
MKRNRGLQLTWGMLMVSVAIIGLLAPDQAAEALVPVTIDDFTIAFGTEADPPLFNDQNVPPLFTQRASQPPPVLPQANVFGSARILELSIVQSAGTVGKAFIDGNTDPSLRAWVVSNDTGSNGRGRIIWNGSSVTTDPLACSLPQPLPYNWDGFYSLRLENVKADQDTIWHVTLFSNNGANSSTASFAQNGKIPIPLKEILRTDFAGSVQFASLCRIEISMDNADALSIATSQVTALLDSPPHPVIHCASKTLGPSPFNQATQKSSLTLPTGSTFDGDLYVQVTVQTTAPGAAAQIDIEDVLPPKMTFQGDIHVQQPSPSFNLGTDPEIGSTGTIKWTTVDLLPEGATLQFYFKVHLALNAPGTATNTFRAKATTDVVYAPGECSAIASLSGDHRVPSLSGWGAIILSFVLAASAIWLLRKRRVS